jgi:ribonuclease J
MRLRIHRGTREIGGTCVELESKGSRILLDLGLPLSGEFDDVSLPAVQGLVEFDPALVAVIISHGHRDHWGLLPKARDDVPIVMGRATERIMRAAATFIPNGFAPKASAYLESGRPLQLGPFRVKPHLVDHSGFDAYALEIEAESRLFYSGDFRAHGRKGKLFERMIANPPRNIDVMLMEGSSLGRLADDAKFPTEADLEATFVEQFRATRGMALVACSAQNIDRVVTIYRAAKRTGRTLIVDAYAAEVLKATGYDSIPQPAAGWPNLAVFIPHRQRVQIKTKGMASIVDPYRPFRVWPEQLAEVAPRSVMLFRGWMLDELDRAGALAGARVFWSQWEGYLKQDSGKRLTAECHRLGIALDLVHTSGHASASDLGRLARAVAPKQLIPIHTFSRERFLQLFDNVSILDDGHWRKLE